MQAGKLHYILMSPDRVEGMFQHASGIPRPCHHFCDRFASCPPFKSSTDKRISMMQMQMQVYCFRSGKYPREAPI